MSPLNKDTAAGIILGTGFFITLGLSVLILAFLFAQSLPVLLNEGTGFITGRQWYAAGDIYGALPMLYGTFTVTLIALLIAMPLGIGSAVITSEFLTGRTRHIVKSLMELLAAIPGVVYGLIGIVLLTTGVRDIFGLIDGNTIFTAGALLGIMILPTIMTLSDDAMRSVPGPLRREARALGLTGGETIRRVVLPGAMKGMAGAVLLGVSRAMGETISVMLVIGGMDRVPSPIYNVFTSGQSITSKLGREGAEALGMGLQWSALAGLGLMLFISVMALTLTGNIIRGGVKRKRVMR
ncbi:MAG: phosphate ABC transporter permease subunit PstC [Thermodesulfobacteriota bacterium]